MSIQAIETTYAGCRFRSRLEARWAVFFDLIGSRWEYEPQGFEIDGHKYLPDFHLVAQDVWVEVKGRPENVNADLLWAFAESTGRPVVILGPIEEPLPRRLTMHPVAVPVPRVGLTLGWFGWLGELRMTAWAPRHVLDHLTWSDSAAELLPVVERAYSEARAARFEWGEGERRKPLARSVHKL